MKWYPEKEFEKSGILAALKRKFFQIPRRLKHGLFGERINGFSCRFRNNFK
jgi:hypothetical protein